MARVASGFESSPSGPADHHLSLPLDHHDKKNPFNLHDDDERECRTGNVWTATAHVITAVIGSGVLSLAWSIAQLGWIAGPPILLAFAFVTYYTSILLADCYRAPDPTTGSRNYTYMDAVRAYLGGKRTTTWICGFVQYVNLIGTAIGYTITASISMVAIKRSNCFHVEGNDAPCHVSNNLYMALFGAFQLFLSMIPNFQRLWWLSIVAAIMSFAYSSIGLALSVGKTIERRVVSGTAFGYVASSSIEKTWLVFQALGNIAFAYSFSMILIEIQDTLRAPPTENKTMKKASLRGIIVTTSYYMSVGCVGYAALGNQAPGDLLTGFGFHNPYWLIDIGNICIAVHLIGAYQVFCQPLFAFVEAWAVQKWPKSDLINHEYKIFLPFSKPFKINLFNVLWRATFVVFTTIVAMLLPFFNDIVGLLGALAFWPLTVYYPISMHIAQHHLKKWTGKWIALQGLNVGCFLVSFAAGLGSIAGIVGDLKKYAPFKMD
ncbi:hypothetical protein GOP47_0019600 [Adiantum capillus-veneris]|uniref:Amino acid transporter transmembrane domain-containing protein n=1 Tax=Adiantum capillus-veneris TaxID=13818 RepID=A0A9D4UBU0_ADICA|nr:hypothetical protein GOP47_0019600 [Adiantum capillus-veneris]